MTTTIVRTLATIPTVVASCLYSEMRVEGHWHSDSGAAFDHWSVIFSKREQEPYEEPGIIKAREDLAALGREKFIRHWGELMKLLDQMGADALYTTLHGVFDPAVEAGLARRKVRTGQA